VHSDSQNAAQHVRAKKICRRMRMRCKGQFSASIRAYVKRPRATVREQETVIFGAMQFDCAR
jgi:hypothetical protein